MLMSLGLIDQKIAWTANVDTAMYAVLIVDIWKTTPFMALLCLAGLQMIPRDMYEAAKIDGIHPVKVFFKVTLPLVKPALMVAVIFRLLDALAHLRPHLRADAELQRHQDHVGHQPREPDRLRQVRLRLGAVDAPVPDHRAVGRSSTSGSARSTSEGRSNEPRQDRRLLPRGDPHRRRRGLPLLLRDHHQLQNRHRALRGQLLPDRVQLGELRQRVQPGRVPAQHPELGHRRHADRRARAASSA